MQTVDDCIEEISEIQIRHKLSEIDNDHAKVQLFACGLYLKGISLKYKLELAKNELVK